MPENIVFDKSVVETKKELDLLVNLLNAKIEQLTKNGVRVSVSVAEMLLSPGIRVKCSIPLD